MWMFLEHREEGPMQSLPTLSDRSTWAVSSVTVVITRDTVHGEPLICQINKGLCEFQAMLCPSAP